MTDIDKQIDPFEEMFEAILYDLQLTCQNCEHPRCINLENRSRNAIKDYISTAVREARIKELEEVSAVMGVVDKVARNYVQDRLAQLKESFYLPGDKDGLNVSLQDKLTEGDTK